jgi:hypothetical protein
MPRTAKTAADKARARAMTAAKRSAGLILDGATKALAALEEGHIPDDSFLPVLAKLDRQLTELNLLASLADGSLADAMDAEDEAGGLVTVPKADLSLMLSVLIDSVPQVAASVVPGFPLDTLLRAAGMAVPGQPVPDHAQLAAVPQAGQPAGGAAPDQGPPQ